MIVLLLSGLDSTAALHRCRPDRAVGFSYGQPHRDAELTAAAIVASRRGVPFDTLLLPEMPHLNPTAGRDGAGVSLAFVPARNALFLTRAAAAYARPEEELRLIVGANADDAAAFPDCRDGFFGAAEMMLRAALFGVCEVKIETPWIDSTKAEIIAWCADKPEALRDIREAVSCYRGTRCGQCDPCALRAAAFATNGIADGAGFPSMHGGDPQRDAAVR